MSINSLVNRDQCTVSKFDTPLSGRGLYNLDIIVEKQIMTSTKLEKQYIADLRGIFEAQGERVNIYNLDQSSVALIICYVLDH